MASKLPKDIADFMAAYSVDADEIWEVRGGAYAIKHKALERVAFEKGVTFEQPTVVEARSAEKIAVVCVTGKMGDRSEWSFGEASPANNKNSYSFAMAEKRAKDRVTLKLLSTHGALYSESEADEFAEKRPNPHVTRPNDVQEPIEYDAQGHPIDNIPLGDPGVDVMTKANARKDWSICEKEIRAIGNAKALEAWGARNANRVGSFPTDWQEMLRGTYRDHLATLRAPQQGTAA